MRFNSKDIADLVGGSLFGENLELEGVSSLENPKERTLIFCPSERDVERVKDVKNATLVVSTPVEHPSYILVKDTKLALALTLEKLYPEEHPTGISEKAHVESSAVLGEDVYVGPFAYVGKNVVLERGVKGLSFHLYRRPLLCGRKYGYLQRSSYIPKDNYRKECAHPQWGGHRGRWLWLPHNQRGHNQAKPYWQCGY
jgi:hypothetical protein